MSASLSSARSFAARVSMSISNSAALSRPRESARKTERPSFESPVMKVVARGARAVPRWKVPLMADMVLDAVGQEPGPSGAVLQGIIFGRTAPHRRERRKFEAPALVIGHPRDPVHPFSDADMLAHELPNGRLLNAQSIVELRLRPARLTEDMTRQPDLAVLAGPADPEEVAALLRVPSQLTIMACPVPGC